MASKKKAKKRPNRIVSANVSFDEAKQSFSVNFDMTLEWYRGIRNVDMVQDIGLEILASMERCYNTPFLDTPETPPIEEHKTNEPIQ